MLVLRRLELQFVSTTDDRDYGSRVKPGTTWRSGRREKLLRPPRAFIQPARHLMPRPGVGEHRPLHLAAVHHVAAAGVEGAAGWRVDRARDIAVDHGRQLFGLGIG